MAMENRKTCFTVLLLLIHSPAPAVEFENLGFDASTQSDPLPGWSIVGEPFGVQFQSPFLARTKQIVVYRGSDFVGRGFGIIQSIDDFSLYIDTAFSNDVGIKQNGRVPADAQSFSLTVNEHHNNFEVQLAGNALSLVETKRDGGLVEYVADVASFAGQEFDLQIMARKIDPDVFAFVIPAGPDSGLLRALVLDNLVFSSTPVTVMPQGHLQAGDADQDLDFDQFDLVRVQQFAKYLTGKNATWGEGDWNGAPGGRKDHPPGGNGTFDQIDVVAALQSGVYLTGPYAALKRHPTMIDEQTSLFYDSVTGELAVDAPASTDLTSINITSEQGLFIGDKPSALDGAFDNFDAHNIFKATFGSMFGDISFGNVLPAGLHQNVLIDDLTVVGSLAGGGDLGEVDCCWLPEPTSVSLMLLGLVIVSSGRLFRSESVRIIRHR